MKSLQKRRSTALILAVVWLAVCLVLTLAMGQTKATEDYEIKLLAAQKLQDWMDDIRDYKLEAGLSLTPYDTHKTGMIGDEYESSSVYIVQPLSSSTYTSGYPALIIGSIVNTIPGAITMPVPFLIT